MDLRSGILGAAQSLGVNPLDLATIISYETAGTFDPAKRGPTTQWGQHRGLIQFGEPQARQHGVDWNNPLGSQLGPDGAIVSYMRSSGVKPGMGLLDLYSAVNAGAPGRYNASDANNGGAPGTVRDKVETQMAGHRAKAEALLGDAGDDTMTGNGGLFDFMQRGGAPSEEPPKRFGDRLREAAKSGALFDGIAMAANTLRLEPDPALAMSVQRSIDRRAEMADQSAQEAKAAQQRNDTAAWIAKMGNQELAQAVAGGIISGRDAFEIIQQQREPKPRRTAYQDGLLIDLDTGEILADHRQAEPPNVDDIGQIRREYMGTDSTRDTMRAGSSFDAMVQAGTLESGAGDIAIVYNYMKLLDPGSTVMQGEYATAENATGVPDRFIAQYNKLLEGDVLSPKARGEFLKGAEEIYMARKRQNDQLRPQYANMIEQLGGSDADLPMLPGMAPTDRAPEMSIRPRAAPAGRASAPMIESGAVKWTAPPAMNPAEAQQAIMSAVARLSEFDRAMLQSIPSTQGKLGFLRDKGLIR
jgi:hypothetical protein